MVPWLVYQGWVVHTDHEIRPSPASRHDSAGFGEHHRHDHRALFHRLSSLQHCARRALRKAGALASTRRRHSNTWRPGLAEAPPTLVAVPRLSHRRDLLTTSLCLVRGLVRCRSDTAIRELSVLLLTWSRAWRLPGWLEWAVMRGETLSSTVAMRPYPSSYSSDPISSGNSYGPPASFLWAVCSLFTAADRFPGMRTFSSAFGRE